MTSDFKYESGDIRLIAIRCLWLSGNLRLKVHDMYKWVRPNDLKSYNLAPADIPIADKLPELLNAS